MRGLLLIQLTLALSVCYENHYQEVDGQLIKLPNPISNIKISSKDDPDEDPDKQRDAVEIIESRGFIGKSYFVTTPDGYILTIHRIINPLFVNQTSESNEEIQILSNNHQNRSRRRNQIKQRKLKPILLQHGLIASSTDFIINALGDFLNDPLVNVSSGRNLGFVLARLGYDVWFGNSRGNTYCRNHTALDPNKDKKFWEFSFDEHALSDLPTTIDFILNETQSQTLSYVGHSQGTLIMFALLSKVPKYNEIIKPFIALAPVALVNSIKSPVKMLAHNPMLLDYFRWHGGQFLPSTDYVKYLSERICESRYVTICSNLLFLFSGFDVQQLNMTRVPVYFSHTPAGTSAWNMIHYAQGYLSGGLKMFDYGRVENIKRYGSEVPPEYHLERITNPYIALMSSLNDWLADPDDVILLKSKLRVPLIDDFQVPLADWNHLDFIWGKDCGTVINQRIVNLLEKYS